MNPAPSIPKPIRQRRECSAIAIGAIWTAMIFSLAVCGCAPPPATITYASFVSEVENDNVSRVVLTPDDVLVTMNDTSVELRVTIPATKNQKQLVKLLQDHEVEYQLRESGIRKP